jgi:putative cardiolipin synthase
MLTGILHDNEVAMKKKMKHLLLLVLILCLAFLAYVLIGAIAPFTVQPEISAATQAAFHAGDYYGHGTGPDRARVVDDNQEALELRLQMIFHARKRVVLSTFDFRDDEAGLDMLAALLDAADRGVEVEIFADGFNSVVQMEGNAFFYALSSHPNAKILIYNQINPLTPWNLMGRMHDKYLIVDDTAYILGGRNTFGYFLGSYEGHKNHDRDVLVYNTGSRDSSLYQLRAYYEQITAQDCCSLFHDSPSLSEKKSVQAAAQTLRDRFQTLTEAYPEQHSAPYDYPANTAATQLVTLISNPIDTGPKEPVAFYQLMELCKGAREQVVIHTPYVIANDWMTQSFSEIGGKGIMLFNSTANNGNPFAAVDYQNHKEELIATGLELHEYEGGVSYHGKSITVDDDLAIIGSFNMDMRSTYIDTELMLVVHSEAVTRQLQDSMDRYDQDAAVVDTVDRYRSTPGGREMAERPAGQKRFQFWLGWALELGRFLL